MRPTYCVMQQPIARVQVAGHGLNVSVSGEDQDG
jgi:hypothetical protein